MSPARLLAASLTDPETRDEWERDYSKFEYPSFVTRYLNKKRDLTITAYASLYCNGITTPFTLNKTEEEAVRAALRAFDKHLRMRREAEALNRLTAPRGTLNIDDLPEYKDQPTADLRRVVRNSLEQELRDKPREGLKPARGETAKTGSTPKARKPDPKGRAK